MQLDRSRQYTVNAASLVNPVQGYVEFDYENDKIVGVGVYRDFRYMINNYNCMNTDAVAKPKPQNCFIAGILLLDYIIGPASLSPRTKADPEHVRFAIYEDQQDVSWAKQINVPFDVIDRCGNVVKDGTSKNAVPIRG